MKILIIHEIDWLKKVVFEPHHLAELFSILGHEVFVIDCPEPDLKKTLDGFKTEKIKKFHRVYDKGSISLIRPKSIRIKGLNRLSYFFTCSNEIEKCVKENKIDLILLYGVATNGIQTIKIAKKLHVPIIFRVLDVAHGLISNPILRAKAKKYEKIVLKNSDKIIATTPMLLEYAINMGASKNNSKYFPLGINANKFQPMIKSEKLQQKLNISKNDFVILFMGTIFEFSGLFEIISSFEQFTKKMKNVKLLIVGGGEPLLKLKSIVKDKKITSNVIFTGFKPQNEIPELISLADICINSFRINSITNNILPTKILEYLACGKPVLSTPLKGTKNLLPNEKFGVIYSDLENFMALISNFIFKRNDLEEIGNAGFEYVQKNHNWEKLSKKLLSDFEILIKSKIENK